MDLNNWLIITAITAFSTTAVLTVMHRNIDVFAAIVFGIITAIGGGTIRDIILGVPVFWSNNLIYIWVALIASVLVYYSSRIFSQKHVYTLILYLDGFGAALFAIQATGKVWDLQFGIPLAPIILGVMTAIGGGLIRDVLAGNQTLLMKHEIYASPVLLGCILYVMVLNFLPEYRLPGSILCILFVFILRAAAIHWNLSVPHWLMAKQITHKQ